MKATIVIVITIGIVVVGAIVGLTLLFGRSKNGAPADAGMTLNLGKTGADGGVFVTEDGGVNWKQRVKFSEKSNIGSIDVNDIVFHPQNKTKIFLASTGNGLFTSTSGSEPWVRVTDEKNVLTQDTTVHQIAFDPKDPQYFYLAVARGEVGRVLRTEDGGKSFKEVYQTPKSKSAVYAVSVDPDVSERLYIGTAEGGLFVSQNRGESWSVVKWFPSPVRRINIHPQDANFMYLTFLGKDLPKIQRSYDHGGTWGELKVNPPKGQRLTGIFGLTFHPTDANVLYLATSAGVFKTPDAGATWQEFPLIIPPSLLPVFSVLVDLKNPENVYVAATSQIYKSRDSGVSWEVHRVPTTKNVRVLVFSPVSSDILWAGLRK
ncbi:MAG: hypothetical protein Q7S09_02880 [bacterium]|nr:hypothetical protein [bacterium]